MATQYKFEKLEVWHLTLDMIDACYRLSEALPRSEEFNLKSQIRRAATSIALNIAEGSTAQSDAEQARFLGFALRSLVEVVACLRIIARRQWELPAPLLDQAEALGQSLFAKLNAFRRAVNPNASTLREDAVTYQSEESFQAHDKGL